MSGWSLPRGLMIPYLFWLVMGLASARLIFLSMGGSERGRALAHMSGRSYGAWLFDSPLLLVLAFIMAACRAYPARASVVFGALTIALAAAAIAETLWEVVAHRRLPFYAAGVGVSLAMLSVSAPLGWGILGAILMVLQGYELRLQTVWRGEEPSRLGYRLTVHHQSEQAEGCATVMTVYAVYTVLPVSGPLWRSPPHIDVMTWAGFALGAVTALCALWSCRSSFVFDPPVLDPLYSRMVRLTIGHHDAARPQNGAD